MAMPSSISSQVTGVDTAACGMRAHRVDRGQGPAPGVLVVVDEHAPFRPVRDPVLRGDERRGAARPGPRRSAWRTPRPPSASARARWARRRGCRASPWSWRRRACPGPAGRLRTMSAASRTRANGTGGLALDRIEVEVHVVRPVHVVAARVPLVEVDAAEVDHPQERGQVLDHREVDDVARLVLDGADLDPVRPRRGRALHEEELAGRAVRVALHDHGPVVEVGQQPGETSA